MERSSNKNTQMLRELKKRKQLCLIKLNKTYSRIKALDLFMNDDSSRDLKLKEYLSLNGYDYRDVFVPIGYYTGGEKVVCADEESKGLSYSKGMKINSGVGFPVPNIKIVTPKDQKDIRDSQFGMIYNSENRTFIPRNVFDSKNFSKADENGDMGMDIMGGLTVQEIGNLNVKNEDGYYFTNFIKELLIEEADLIEDECDLIEGAINKLTNNYSNADGDTKSGRNAVCRAGCATKHPFKKSKREECNKDCDSKFPPSIKQEERREDRQERKEARKEFRSDKKSCKESLKSNEINRSQYKDCLKRERQEKRSEIKESGGNIFVRSFRTFAKINPLTAVARGGALILIDMNAFGFATRLSPALLPEDEANKKFTSEAIQLSKKGWDKVSRAWKNLGGNPKNLEEKIINGYRKKPLKVKSENTVKSGFEGVEYKFSNFGGAELATAVTTGLSVIAGLIGALNKVGAKKNPYKEGEAPQEYLDAMKDGTINEVPQQESDKPHLDPNTGQWIDPTTGKVVDPTTGKFKDEIFGINKWLAISIGVVGVFGIYYLLKNKK